MSDYEGEAGDLAERLDEGFMSINQRSDSRTLFVNKVPFSVDLA